MLVCDIMLYRGVLCVVMLCYVVLMYDVSCYCMLDYVGICRGVVWCNWLYCVAML